MVERDEGSQESSTITISLFSSLVVAFWRSRLTCRPLINLLKQTREALQHQAPFTGTSEPLGQQLEPGDSTPDGSKLFQMAKWVWFMENKSQIRKTASNSTC